MGLEDGWDGRRQPLGTVAKGQERKVTAILAEPTTLCEDNQDLQAGGAACPPSSQRCASSQPGTSAGSSRDQGCPRTSPPSTAVLSTPHLALERWSFVGHFMTPSPQDCQCRWSQGSRDRRGLLASVPVCPAQCQPPTLPDERAESVNYTRTRRSQ